MASPAGRKQVKAAVQSTARGQDRPRPKKQLRKKVRRRSWVPWAAGGGAALIGVALFVLLLIDGARAPGTSPAPSAAALGSAAPDASFTTTDGRTLQVSSLEGKPTLLWFVTTWCPSCQTGTQVMAQQVQPQLNAKGVQVVELELYNNLGGQGPDVGTFGRLYAGKAYGNPNWVWGTASQNMSVTYDPKGYLDIYYLLDAQGHIRYVNGSPESTGGALLNAVQQLPQA